MAVKELAIGDGRTGGGSIVGVEGGGVGEIEIVGGRVGRVVRVCVGSGLDVPEQAAKLQKRTMINWGEAQTLFLCKDICELPTIKVVGF